MANSYRVRRRSGPTTRVSDIQRVDLLGGLQSGRSFSSESEARAAWHALRAELIGACAPNALPWALWQYEVTPDDCTDNHVEAAEDAVAAFDRVTRARTEWARRVHFAMAARRTTKEA